jgi:hypothetical protein
MTALHPAMLWGLLAAGLPILIHLLNRLRHRTVRWGAMMFLLRVTRSSTRHARLRHYLILALRTLAVAAFAAALARPLAGGGWGAWLAGAPDAIVVLLDRSASMERTDPRHALGARAHALALLAGLPPELSRGSRVTLIDSARLEPREIGALAALPELDAAGPTDTAADGAALFETALDWMARSRPGRTEWWVVTDGQTSNWRPGRGVWPDLAARLAAQAPPVRLRLLQTAHGTPAGNRGVQLRAARRVPGVAGRHELSFAVLAAGAEDEPVPATWTAQGARTLLPLEVAAPVTERTMIASMDPDAVGWSRVDLPADENPRDNAVWFAYGPPPSGAVWLRADEDVLRARVLGAFAGDGAAGAVRAWPADAPPDLATAALVLWAGAPPEGADAAALSAFVQAGGVVFALPPGDAEAAVPPAGGGLGWGWSGAARAEAGAPWRPAHWEAFDGPWARAASGEPLPVGGLSALRRCTPLFDEPDAWFALAQFGDGAPALLRRRLGAGRIYALATRPHPDWSTFDDGRVWVPALWRMREEGAGRMGRARMALCGLWRPEGTEDLWTPVDPEDARDPRTQAGVYRQGDRLLALNRPPEEDDPSRLDAEDWRTMLPGITVRAIGAGGADDAIYSEISLPLLLLAGVALLAEALLALLDFATAKPVVEPVRKEDAA